MKVKKFAQKFYNEKKLIILKRNEDKYYLSDTHCIIKIDNSDMEKFVEKWNGYSRTQDIPDLSVEEQIVSLDHDEWEKGDFNFKYFFLYDDKGDKIKLTDIFYKTQVRLILGNDYICGVDTDYVDYFEDVELFQVDKNEPINVFKEGEMVGVIMPYIPDNERYDKMFEDLKEIGGILEEE